MDYSLRKFDFVDKRFSMVREKLNTSLHCCLLFVIHIYFSDFFLDFSRGLNSIDNNLRDGYWISPMENFCDISCKFHFLEKFKICEICNSFHAKINPLILLSICLWKKCFWLRRFLTINDLNINFALSLIPLISLV